MSIATKMTQFNIKAKIMKTNLGITPGVSDCIDSIIGCMHNIAARILKIVIKVV